MRDRALALVAPLALGLALGWALHRPAPCSAAAGVAQVHYAPAENLEALDVALIDGAERTLDLAAYVLTDRPVIAALERAARRGVTVRIYRTALVHAYDRKDDGAGDTAADALARVPGVQMRVKRSRTFMHLKSYAVDGRILRAGAANFSASGLKRQDNDLVLLRDPAAAAAFAADFARIWEEGDPVVPAAEAPSKAPPP